MAMATSQIDNVLKHLRRAILRKGSAGVPDSELLKLYVTQGDEAAFEALVRRHGPMILGVCRRILHNAHDAEDAFQATFLVLVRKASGLRSPANLGNWLYGVACRTAREARRAMAKRRVKEATVVSRNETSGDAWSDLVPVLDEELERLPEKYRLVIVLCDLEGKTRKEAARHLGLPDGTVGSRLARARVMLAKRLAQRGVVLSGAALAAVLAQNVASAVVPNSVVSSTISAANLFTAGPAAAAGVISLKVAALTEGVLKTMFPSKLKAVVAVVLVLGFLGTGATVLSGRTAPAQSATPAPPIAEERVKTPQKQEQEREKEAFTAWGKEVGGLQAGLGYHPGQTHHKGQLGQYR